MEIRKAQNQDIPQIVELLKTTLGEQLLTKSEALWNWKHRQNPFGASPVLLAEENSQLVGVRAFLPWKYSVGDKQYSAYRAVDTAVHPDYQGKGIFTKLTLDLINEIRAEGADFIFNTPNEKSAPGYLKMGWEKYKKLPLHLSLNPNFHKKPGLTDSNWKEIETLLPSFEKKSKNSTKLVTSIQPGFIQWRYAECPLFPYSYLTDHYSYLLVYRVKKGKWTNELRICDLYKTDNFNPQAKANLQRGLTSTINNSGCHVVSYSGLLDNRDLDLHFLPKLSLGPLVTLRVVNSSINPFELPWSWSLGDLEVF